MIEISLCKATLCHIILSKAPFRIKLASRLLFIINANMTPNYIDSEAIKNYSLKSQ